MQYTNEEKIFGLIVQAQEMQKYALEFRETAKKVINGLPDAAKNAISESATIIENQAKYPNDTRCYKRDNARHAAH